jgi:hypothetical protein
MPVVQDLDQEVEFVSPEALAELDPLFREEFNPISNFHEIVGGSSGSTTTCGTLCITLTWAAPSEEEVDDPPLHTAVTAR